MTIILSILTDHDKELERKYLDNDFVCRSPKGKKCRDKQLSSADLSTLMCFRKKKRIKSGYTFNILIRF